MAVKTIADLGKGIKIVKVTVSGPASYPSGGFTVDVPGVMGVLDVLKATNNGGYIVHESELDYNERSRTIKVPVKGAPVNVTHAACGATGAAYASATVLATIRDSASEVANGTDLSSVTFEFTLLVRA